MAQPTTAQVRLLIVETSAESADALSTLLARGFGERVTLNAQPSGAAACDFLARFGADLLIVNARLPDGSGINFCRMVRTELGLTDLPILLVADGPSTEDRLEQLSSSADDIIARPIQDRLLLARVELLWRMRGSGGVLRG